MVIIMQTNLLDASITIGSIAETNNSYFTYLESQLDKSVDTMTVSELMEIHQACIEKYNQMLSREVAQ